MESLEKVIVSRWKVAGVLTLFLVALYFGFIGLVAFNKEFMAQLIVEGLSTGIVLGVLVIFSAWFLTFLYVRWANEKYDAAVKAAKARGDK